MSSELRYDGRVAIVTGAGAGLGREYALLLGSRGAKVVVNDLGGSHTGEGASQRAADVVVNEIKAMGGEACADYNSVVDGEKIVETAIRNYGRIDIVINNAGILRDRSFPKISAQDWDLIQDVHVKGSFKTSQAAFPYMKKQNFGRIIMTSSNSGIHGNFGQANYSTAKLGLIGLANTIAIEGAKYNVHCNCIVPTAASRMTEGIIPDILFRELKPELIAPVVAYLVHESCNDNGAVIESAGGWATKVHFVRGKGTVLRSKIDQKVIKPEEVAKVWGQVTDMSNAYHTSNMAEASGHLLDVLENLRDGKIGEGIQEDIFKFTPKDLVIYALGIGASTKNKNDLKFLYESDVDFAAIPSFFVLPALLLQMGSSMVADALPHQSVDLTSILHGEQYIEIMDNALPQSGELVTRGKVIDVMDKGSGALVVTQAETYDSNGDYIVKNQSAIFVVGAGKFGGKKTPSADCIPIVPTPTRAPDASITYQTSKDQAALYRMSGDLNPLHIDPNFSIIAGHAVPILHGLCTLGFSVRAVLEKYANNDPSLFKAVKARFSNPVIPGQSLKIDMWKKGKRINFKTSIVENGKEVITGAYVDLKTDTGSSKL